jgi:hypothetical protein
MVPERFNASGYLPAQMKMFLDAELGAVASTAACKVLNGNAFVPVPPAGAAPLTKKPFPSRTQAGLRSPEQSGPGKVVASLPPLLLPVLLLPLLLLPLLLLPLLLLPLLLLPLLLPVLLLPLLLAGPASASGPGLGATSLTQALARPNAMSTQAEETKRPETVRERCIAK